MEARADLTVQHRSMADEVTDRIRRLILSRELHPGQRIRQAELAAMMSVSTMPVREALLRLVAEGMVLADSNRSFTVAMTTTPAGIRDVYWVHSVLAGELTARAWPMRDDTLLQFMRDRHQGYVRALKSGSGGHPVLFRENWEFHSAIHHAAGAPALGLTLKNALRYFPDFSYDVPGWNDIAAEWQAGLIAEFTEGTADGAREVVATYSSKSAELYIAAYWPEGATSTGRSTKVARNTKASSPPAAARASSKAANAGKARSAKDGPRAATVDSTPSPAKRSTTKRTPAKKVAVKSTTSKAGRQRTTR